MKTHLLALLVGGISVGTWLDAAEARACGACFHAGTDTSTSFVTDHRMVVSISPQQTVLWDQVKYTGNPSEFAWVLPVRDGTRVELARNEWIETLDQATSVSVQGPDLFCGGGGSGVGCGSSDMSATAGSGGYANDGNVQIVDQKVVGPYETVIVRSSSGEAIHEWLRINGFPVADSIAPILASYTKQGFDFLALKLRPQTGTQAMRPVRVVMPGAGATLPLRMVAGGIGAKVGLTLFVISEARHQAKNAPNAVVDRSRLAWDMATSRSNYRELAEQALAETGGRGWLTEYAGTPFMSTKQWYDRLYARDAEAARRSGLGSGSAAPIWASRSTSFFTARANPAGRPRPSPARRRSAGSMHRSQSPRSTPRATPSPMRMPMPMPSQTTRA